MGFHKHRGCSSSEGPALTRPFWEEGKNVFFILKVKQPEVRRYFGLPLSNLLQVWLADFWLPLPSVHINSAPAELREVHALSEY